MTDNSKNFRLQIITPDRVFYDGEAELVELTTSEGEMGILKGHIPLTAVLVPGVLKIKEAEQMKKAALHDGFVEIFQEYVTILAEACEWPEEIDVRRAKDAKYRAEQRLSGGEDGINIARAELALKRSLIRLQLAEEK